MQNMPGEPRKSNLQERLANCAYLARGSEPVTFVSSAWLAAIVENSSDAILSKTLDGIIMSWSAGAEKLFGFTAEEAVGRPITIIIPEDRLHEEEAILGRLRAGQRINEFETVRQRKDGTLVDIMLSASPVRDGSGRILGAAKVVRDITAIKRAAERQDLILRETNHRIKNLFTLATALVSLSGRGASSVKELTADLIARFHALARAHTLTMPDLTGEELAETGTTTLAELLRTILAPHDDGSSRITMHGGDIGIGPQALPTLALVLHELATNAAKYGGLAETDGRLRIDIAIIGEEAQIGWQEVGAPREGAPQPVAGFGSKLEKASMADLRGSIERAWRDDGVTISLTIPLESLVG